MIKKKKPQPSTFLIINLANPYSVVVRCPFVLWWLFRKQPAKQASAEACQSKMKIKLFKKLKICEIVKRDQMFKLTKALHARHCCCGIMPQLVSLFSCKLVFRSQFLCLTTHNSGLFILFKVLIVVCSVPQALAVWRHIQNNRQRYCIEACYSMILENDSRSVLDIPEFMRS